eukprot:COSAG01_NODE_67739_length_266_cov_0.616766_1_plen_65_part_01
MVHLFIIIFIINQYESRSLNCLVAPIDTGVQINRAYVASSYSTTDVHVLEVLPGTVESRKYVIEV